MRTLITGANGYIGSHLVDQLLQQGHDVNALIFEGTDASMLENKPVKIFTGDVRNYESLEQAVAGCETVFHLASLVGIWNKNPRLFHEINVKGTENLLRACQSQDVRRVLICSSCGIFGPSKNGEFVDETRYGNARLTDPYEVSKYRQVELGKRYLGQGLEVVFVYPTRVFGPGIRSDGNSLTSILEGVANGTWRIILGSGKNVANYIFVDDVVRGMSLAMEKGENGEGYILGGTNVTYDQLFGLLQKISGKQIKLTRVPYPVLRMVAFFEVIRSKITGKKPFITAHAAKKYTSDWPVSTQKIQLQLGFQPTPLEVAMRLTLEANKAFSEGNSLLLEAQPQSLD
jgi:nucleoside-diphosphate-sugar epimerase